MSRDAPTLSEQYGPGADDDDIYTTIDIEAHKHHMSDIDVWCAWRLGLAAYLEMRKLDGQFIHDPSA